jgi:uncharacterized surface protein with fasciclin (FAS1) repeats
VLTGIDLSDPAADPVTVVGPANDAFALLDPAVATFLTTTPDGLIELTRILLYHVFSGIPVNILTEEFIAGGGAPVSASVATLEGGAVLVSRSPLKFNQARAFTEDFLANNGVLIKIDRVLDPDDGR